MFDLATGTKLFQARLAALKQTRVDFDWYPYDSLTNVQHLDRLLAGDSEPVWRAASSKGVLDVGCGDGDLSFLFESLGCAVTAVDYPVTNHNGMRGIAALHTALESKVHVREMDIDVEPLFPGDAFGLTLFLGTLYHLKNPLSVMERLARASEYCIVSTRIAGRFPGGEVMPRGEPIAYLLAEDELNRDDSNFWIFSNAGLRRLFERTGWEVLRSFHAGDTTCSDPVHPDHDERAFCLLKSHYGLSHLELLEGWYEPAGSGWRWTSPRFSALVNSAGGKYRRIRMRVFVPPEVVDQVGPVTLHAGINGVSLHPETIREPGDHMWARSIPKPADKLHMDFHIDKVFRFPGDDRELGIIVSSLELD